jgi:hypothetical protein
LQNPKSQMRDGSKSSTLTRARDHLLGDFLMTHQSHAQTQTSTSTTTAVFALPEAKPGVTRERVMAIMPAEIRATVQL